MKKIIFSMIAMSFLINQCAINRKHRGNIIDSMFNHVTIVNEDNSKTYINNIHGKYLVFTIPEKFQTPVVHHISYKVCYMASYLEGESDKKWTQNINAFSDRIDDVNSISLENKYKMQSIVFDRYCAQENKYYMNDISTLKKIGEYETTAFVQACSNVKNMDFSGSFETLIVNFQTPTGYYSLIWVERGPVAHNPFVIDKKKWQQRLRQMEPFGVFDTFLPKAAGSSSPLDETAPAQH